MFWLLEGHNYAEVHLDICASGANILECTGRGEVREHINHRRQLLRSHASLQP